MPLNDYDLKTAAESGWVGWQTAAGGLALAIAAALGADAILAGAIAVFVTASSRAVLIVGAKMWAWMGRKLDASGP